MSLGDDIYFRTALCHVTYRTLKQSVEALCEKAL